MSARGEGWSRRVELDRGDDGGWSVEASADGAVELAPPGGDAAPLAGALDTDLGLSPLFNSMPALRHRLHEEGGAVEFLMAWVSVPDLAVRPLRQRYTHLRADGEPRLVRYESLSESGEAIFSADLRFDADGLVVDYPGLATMEPREP